MEYKAGDVVTLAENATYYNGKEIPAWVKSNQWIIKSVEGNRAVIDKNVAGTSFIKSPIHIQHLEKIQAPELSTRTETILKEMQISSQGIDLIAKYEGCKLTAYKCPAGIWTIGYGHTVGVHPGDTLSSAEAAKELFATDLIKYAGYVNACMEKGQILFPLNQNQFDALISFTYNCGRGSLRKLVSDRDAVSIADAILRYNKGGGKVLKGLVKRRKEERTLFLG